MEIEHIQNAIVDLYLKFQADIIMEEKNGGAKCTDNSFNFESFINWLVDTNP